jgi:hypothetical protein
MIPVWEVDQDGEIIEHDLWTEDQIEEAKKEGRHVVDFAWGPGFWDHPVFDLTNNRWIEGNPIGPVIKKREMKKAELNQQCEAAILGRFPAVIQGQTFEFSYDEQAQSRFNGVGLLFQKGTIRSIEWTAYLDGQRTRITLTSDDFDAISLAAMLHCDNNVVKYNDLLKEVDQAVTVDKINAIKWDQ